MKIADMAGWIGTLTVENGQEVAEYMRQFFAGKVLTIVATNAIHGMTPEVRTGETVQVVRSRLGKHGGSLYSIAIDTPSNTYCLYTKASPSDRRTWDKQPFIQLLPDRVIVSHYGSSGNQIEWVFAWEQRAR